MKVSFLFWNLCRGKGPDLLASLGRFAAQGIDVFLFAEGPDDPKKLEAELSSSAARPYRHAESKNARVLFFSSLQGAIWTDRFEDTLGGSRITAQELELPGTLGLLIVGAHLDAANFESAGGQAERARLLAGELRRIEQDVGHDRTILVGDLNMNPFDDGLVSTTALHAVMSKDLIGSVRKIEARKEFPPFYNPMWSCLGDLVESHSVTW
jgi:hypothetical protein